jgi:aminopeptidase N
MTLRSLTFFILIGTTVFAAYRPTNRPYDVISYKLGFEFDPRKDPKELEASVDIVGKAKSALSSVELNAEELRIDTVKAFGKKVPHSLKEKILSISLGREVSAGKEIRLHIAYAAKIRASHEGFFKVTDPDEPERGNLYFTMLEAESARQLFPCNDEPYDKAITEVVGRVPQGLQVVSNGKLLKTSAVMSKGTKWSEFHWKMGKPHSTYLLSLAIGNFHKIKDRYKDTELSYYVGNTKLEKARYVIEATKKSMAFFEEYLGVPYPWEKYATIGIPTYLWGGMENTSSTHMNQERILLNHPLSSIEKRNIAGLAAHELAHQWFGDLVTMKWWDDVWLNEAFASYMDTLGENNLFRNEEATIGLVTNLWDSYFREEDGPRSHAIVNAEMTSAGDGFDSTNYTKGEAVLRMLGYYLGEEKFRAGVKQYLTEFAYKNADYKDFFAVMSKVSGTDLSAFRDSWLLKRGYPVVKYEGDWKNKEKIYKLKLQQKPNHETDSHTFIAKLPVVFHRIQEPAFTKEVVVELKDTDITIAVNLPAEPQWVSVNPGGYVLARVEPEDHDEEVLALQSENDPDPVTRVWANFQLADRLLKAKDPSSFAQKALLKNLSEEKSPYVRIATLELFQRVPVKELPSSLANGLLQLARESSKTTFKDTQAFKTDPHGWLEYRSRLFGALGKTPSKEALPFLTTVLKDPNVSLDDFMTSTKAVAMTADEKSIEILKETLAQHQEKGYRYRYHVYMAYGALENPKAAAEIAKLSQTVTSDLMGKIGNTVRDNHTLKSSEEWALFLRDFVLTNERFGEEVKTRLIGSIEDVKSSPVKRMLEILSQQSASERIRELTKKILTKNFPA